MTKPQVTEYDVLIVGGGQAGAQCAHALRARKVTCSIAILSAEEDPPYERPPLSKDYLLGQRDRERLFFRAETYWKDHEIQLHPGAEVVAVDPADHQVTTADGRVFGYRRLVWAAGGTARRPTVDGLPDERVFTIRTLPDIDRLKAALENTRTVTVLGGGYIGLEAAAVLRKLGREVTVIEAAPKLLSRVASSKLSDYLREVHESHGVTFRLGASARKAWETASGQIALDLTDDGPPVTSDIVIAGIGIDANVRPLIDAGALGENGVDINRFCETSLPDIYAIGDCARFVSTHGPGTPVRVESVQNANDQAKCVAAHIAGEPTPYQATPWFWSDQYDIKLQTVGLTTAYDEVRVRGDRQSGAFSVLYFRSGRFVGLDAIRRPMDFAGARAILGLEIDPDDPRLVDLDIPLQTLAA